MDYRRIGTFEVDALWELQKLYKAEIGEEEPKFEDRQRLEKAIDEERILFFGVLEGNQLVGCCSITIGFSTFDYMPSGVFEDFYIRPEYRHKGIASRLVQYAYLSLIHI